MATKDYARRFGERVRELRRRAGLSQEQLAHLAGLHPTHISLIEGGRRSVRIETVAALARALRTQPSNLMPDL